MTRVFYKDAVGAVVVYDVTRPRTFEAAAKWKQDIDSKVFLPNERSIPTILCANKVDLSSPEAPTMDKVQTFCNENDFRDFFETSAKDSQSKGINEGITSLISMILESGFMNKVEKSDADENESVVFDLDQRTKQQSTGCCARST
jgi:GTPase SAR1 family protein